MKETKSKRVVIVKKLVNNAAVINNTVHMLESMMEEEVHRADVVPVKIEDDPDTSCSAPIDNLAAAAQVSDMSEMLRQELVAVCEKIIGIVGWNALRDWCEEILASFCVDHTDAAVNAEYVNAVGKKSPSEEVDDGNARFIDDTDVQQDYVIEQEGTDFIYSQDGSVVAYEDIVHYDNAVNDAKDVYSQNHEAGIDLNNSAVVVPAARQTRNIHDNVMRVRPTRTRNGDLANNQASSTPVVSRHGDLIESEDNSVVGMADVIVLQYGEDIETDDVDIMDEQDNYPAGEDKACVISPLYGEGGTHQLVDVVDAEDVDLTSLCESVLYSDNSATARHSHGRKVERSFGCVHCGKCYRTISDLNLHQKTHTGELSTVCSICGKTFSRLESLKRHLTIHNEMKIKCDLCEKTFASKEGCLRHVKSTHKIDESTHVCTRCGKKCCSGYELKKHETWCRGERPYECRHCGKRFAAAGNMRTHEMIHTGERPYGCKQCHRRFVSSSYVKVHVRQVHSNERPFKCTKCDKAFAVPQVLKLHQLVHSGVRPYTCMQCGKKLSSRSAFKGHQAMHVRASTGALPTHSRRGLKRTTKEVIRLNL